MPKERFLVTGCAGFIGGHMLDRLLIDEIPVTGVDDFSTGSRENLEPYLDRIEFVEGSLVDPGVARLAVQGVDRVIHLASIPSVPRSVDNPRESADNSIIATVNLLVAARNAGVKRVVQASSSSVYGDSPVQPRVESLLPEPLSPYAVAKLTQEYYGQAFYKCYGLECLSLRYFNVFGPRQNPESKYAAVIPKFISYMLLGESPVIFGDGNHTRDFTYIGNVVEANYKAALADGVLQGEALNIGNGSSVSLSQLVVMLNDILGTELKPVHAAPRTGDVLHSQADITKAEKMIGYRPEWTLEMGLRRTVEYFQGL